MLENYSKNEDGRMIKRDIQSIKDINEKSSASKIGSKIVFTCKVFLSMINY